MGQSTNQTNSERTRRDEATGLAGARAEFAVTLPRRLEAIEGAIAALSNQLRSSGLRDNLLRRIHALSASAKVLGFAATADLLTRAEQRIRTSQDSTLLDDLGSVRKLLADLPALVNRTGSSVAPARTATASSDAQPPPTVLVEPFAILLFGKDTLKQALLACQPVRAGLEIAASTDAGQLRQLAATMGPDVLLLDAAEGSVTLLVDELTQAEETSSVPIVALNVPDEATASLIELGVRGALSPRLTEQQILRAVLQVARPVDAPPAPALPLGDVSLKELAERLAQETYQGLVESANSSALRERIALGDGTVVRAALWSALAQIREHVIERTNGKIRFERGPDGSYPLAPGHSRIARGSGQPVESVDLLGRRILVVDDDPAVAWLVGGTLSAAGASVTIAHEGDRALELAYREWPELIITDILMPGLDGFALCHALKRDVLLRDVPVVLLSWKEDLLFRLRELGADADGYLHKEAHASTIVEHVRELLLPRQALERRLAQGLTSATNEPAEVRGRLDRTTVRQLLEISTGLQTPVRVLLRDYSAIYELRVRDGSLKAATRTRHDGTVERGPSVLSSLVGITAGRFSISTDREPCEPDFNEPLTELLRPAALRARAAQQLLSSTSLTTIDRLVLDPEAFSEEPNVLPLSLRPVADELQRGIAPRQLLASGAASAHVLESLLADVARRGKIRAILGRAGADLLEGQVAALARLATPSTAPSAPPAPPLFTFQLTPQPPEVHSGTPTAGVTWQTSGGKKGNWTEPGQPPPPPADDPSSTTIVTGAARHPASHANEDLDWAEELNWDTPAPLPSEPSAPKPLSSKPASSIAFMRPALVTLEPHPHSETPDLANAVVRAVSEFSSDPPHCEATLPPQAAPPEAQAIVAPATTATDQAIVVPAPTTTDPPIVAPATTATDQAIVAPATTATDEPVFPLVSTNPPPTESPSPKDARPDATNGEVGATHANDTLRSPSDETRGEAPTNVPTEADPAPTEADPASTTVNTPASTDARERDAPSDNPAKTVDQQSPVTSPPAPVSTPSPATSRTYTWPQAIALTFGAFALTFAAFATVARSCQSQARLGESRQAVPGATALAPTAEASTDPDASAKVAPPPSTTKLEAIPLPPEVSLGPNQALLEVTTSGGHAIFVDDAFVGRGPSRLVTVPMGHHVVRTRLNGAERTDEVEVQAGRSLRLNLQ